MNKPMNSAKDYFIEERDKLESSNKKLLQSLLEKEMEIVLIIRWN